MYVLEAKYLRSTGHKKRKEPRLLVSNAFSVQEKIDRALQTSLLVDS